MKLFSAAEMREVDRQAPAAGLSLQRLMRRAGRAVAREALANFPGVRHWHVLAGPGNNGGDGWVAALALLKSGRPVTVWQLSAGRPASAPAAWARDASVAAGCRYRLLDEAGVQEIVGTLGPGHGVMDALFGNGLNRPLAPSLLFLAGQLRLSGTPVVAVDVPSGLDPDLAHTDSPHFPASLTVALGGLKAAHVFEPARSACGVIRLDDLGLPAQLLDGAGTSLLELADAAQGLPRLRASDHKYSAGTVCLIAGSGPYRGAAELAARAAWRSGAGLVTLVADGVHPSAWPETIWQQHHWSDAWPPVGLDERRAAACLIGPGLAPAALASLGQVLEWAPGPVVLDATALQPQALAAVRQLLPQRQVVLTPHAGEAARLMAEFLPTDAGLLRTDPLAAARRLARELAVTVVLKGPATVIADAGGRAAVSRFGHPALATGGSGDVLGGVIATMLARPLAGTEAFDRICAGVVLHGLAGQLAASEYDEGMRASDLVSSLPRAHRKILQASA